MMLMQIWPHLAARVQVAILAALALALLASPAHGKGSKRTYYFLVHEIKLADGIPAELGALIQDQITRAIVAHEQLIEALPADAPDPQTDVKGFQRYIKKHKLQPYRVNVEIIEYEHDVAELPAPRKGQRLTVSISLRTFGETIPARVMAFSGEGSATVKMDIGKRLRPRDTEVGNQEAAQLAIAEALAISLTRLEGKLKEQKKGPRSKK